MYINIIYVDFQGNVECRTKESPFFFSEIELSIVYSGFHELLDLQAIEEKRGPEDRN